MLRLIRVSDCITITCAVSWLYYHYYSWIFRANMFFRFSLLGKTVDMLGEEVEGKGKARLIVFESLPRKDS